MKIVELKIDDTNFSGVDAVALVESPAIETDFIAFNKVNMAEMTYDDYPQAAVDAARRGIELNKKNNMKCATQVGKVRAQQLVNGEKLSLDTIQRMRSFLIRQKGNYELAVRRKDYNACGYISYLLWGGEAALPWAEKKLRQSNIGFDKFSLYENVGFDFDGVLTTAEGRALAKEEIAKGNHVFIISARDNKDGMLDIANELGIPDQNVFAAKTNMQKLNYVQTLNIDRYYDDNPDVIGKIPGIGHKFADTLLPSNIPQIAPNEPQDFEGLEDACQPGYKAIGLKTKNGRKVPNCVPEEKFEEELANYIIADLLGIDEEDFDINVAMLPNYINEASTGKKKNYFEENEVLPSILDLKKNKFSSELAEKQMLVGPLMTPGKLIPRVDEETGNEYKVFFSADTIEKIAYKMMQDKLVDSVNIEHDNKQKVDDAYLIETWIVKDPEHDKSTLYGFKPVKGEWFGIYKIDNRPIWNEYIKTGKVKGFSVEGYFYNNILTKK